MFPSTSTSRRRSISLDHFVSKDLTADRASRTYALQWIALQEVARHLGITAEQADLSYPLFAALS